MVAGTAARTLRGSGRLVLGPTNLSNPYPYGGVEVGRTKAVSLQPLGQGYRVISEALGEASDILEASNEFVFSCFVRGWDDDAVELLLSDGEEEGPASQHRVWGSPGAVTPGASALPRAVVALYVPDDLIHVPAVLVYRGVPAFLDGAALAWQRNEELGIPIALDCMRDAAGRIVSVGLLADLEL